MAIVNKIRGGSGSNHRSGRMDYPYAGDGSPSPQNAQYPSESQEQETHSLAHADGFTGPRVGEVYGAAAGDTSKDTLTQQHGVPVGGGQAKGGNWAESGRNLRQNNPASKQMQTNGQTSKHTGVAARQAIVDYAHGTQGAKTYQHKGSGNFVEVNGGKVNEHGTTATGHMNSTKNDVSLNGNSATHVKGPNTNPATDTENYTDVTDKVRGSSTYKAAKIHGTR